MEERFILDEEKLKKIRLICSVLERGSSAKKLEISLHKFIKTEIQQTNPELYRELKEHYPVEASLKRLLKTDGHLMRARHPYLEKMLDMYIETYRSKWDHLETHSAGIENADYINDNLEKDKRTFSPGVILTLSQRAAGICSNPYCRRLTSGPVLTDPGKAYNLGMACFIHGVKPGDPRYNPLLSYENDDIENGIWLCSFDAQMINENGGTDYPANLLKDWKHTHEQLMQACLEGKKKIFFALNQNDNQSPLAAVILAFFNKQHLLFEIPGLEIKENIIITVKGISTFLLEQDINVTYGTRLQQQVLAIDYTCDAFLDLVRKSGDTALFSHCFAAFKKVIGMVLAEIAVYYKVKLPVHISEIVPETL